MDFEGIIFMATFVLNFVYLFNRKSRWANNSIAYASIGVLFLSATFLYLNLDQIPLNKPGMTIGALLTPLTFLLLNKLVKLLCQQLYNRDMYLWLRGSSEINDHTFSGGSHVRAMDRVFSMLLLFTSISINFLIGIPLTEYLK